MRDAPNLTLQEASYVVGQPSTAINRAIDQGVIKAKRGRSRLREIGHAELRFLTLAHQVEKDLTPAARRKVYAAIRRMPSTTQQLSVGLMAFEMSAVDQRIETGLQRLRDIKAFVDETGDLPVLRGTTIPVHTIAALARGQSAAEMIEDIPGLSHAMIAAAVEYAKVYPRTGRPPATRSFKRTLRDLAASGAWHVDDDPDTSGPRLIP